MRAYTAFQKHQAGRGYKHSEGQDENPQPEYGPLKRKSETNKYHPVRVGAKVKEANQLLLVKFVQARTLNKIWLSKYIVS